MNRELLLALQKRNNERLIELRGQLENTENRELDVEAITKEVEDIQAQLQTIADQLADEGSNGEDTPPADGVEGRSGEEGGEGAETENRSAVIPENRQAAMGAIASALSTRGHKSAGAKAMEQRKAFAQYVVGQITEAEARSFGIVTGHGGVVVPEVIASEVITYAQEENLLRKYGSIHRTAGDVKYPVLVTKAEANVTKTERTADMSETTIELDEILLSPAEFDALATVTKKLTKMSGVKIEDIVIEELKKAYVRKETSYMFKGADVGHENTGSLYNKAVAFEASFTIDYTAAGWSQVLHAALVRMKNTPKTEVLKKSMWIVNRAALTKLESMIDTTGRPLLHVDATDGVTYKLLGHKLDFTDDADGANGTTPHFYFGDFKSFHIQEVIGALEIQRLVEKYAAQNKIGFQIYNLLDGQLIYSALEPTMYKFAATQSV